MTESQKALTQFGIVCCLVVFSLSFIFEPFFWVWAVRVLCILCAILLSIALTRYYQKKDLVPEFLKKDFGDYFERDGFCFALRPTASEGGAVLLIAFQSRYDQLTKAHLETKLFGGFLEKDELWQKDIHFEIPPAAYGISKIKMPIPRKYQGKTARIEVGASITYPQGKGRMVRFRDGTRVGGRNLTSNLSPWLALIGVFFGIHAGHSAYLRFTLPSNVSESVEQVDVDTKIIWQMRV